MSKVARKSAPEESFEWRRQPQAHALLHELVAQFCAKSAAARQLGERMLRETGTRFIDWVDFVAPPRQALDRRALVETGFTIGDADGTSVTEHPGGMFPTIRLDGRRGWSLGLKVESVADFLNINGIGDARVEGAPYAALRMARIARGSAAELWVVERHSQLGFTPHDVSAAEIGAVLHHTDAFRCRRRRFERDEEGIEHALELINAAVADLGAPRACDLFFMAERAYWESRNRAGRKGAAGSAGARLGESRPPYLSQQPRVFCQLDPRVRGYGPGLRERFSAGSEAGWGAQILEHPVCRITAFADVDLSPEEVSGDFAHAGLEPRRSLGTIGLWCKLHGEALLQAGMHHLEAQFDFDTARAQLEREGVMTMEPFTDFTHLRQAFTQGEMWPIEPSRLEVARAAGFIADEQAEKFAKHGALGSHLETLERNEGYKGFNRIGISQIIRRTDPRTNTVAA
jgi:hypothetical protein